MPTPQTDFILSDHQERIRDLEKDQGDTKTLILTALGRLENRFDSFEGQFDELKGAVLGLRSDVSEITGSVVETKTDLSTFRNAETLKDFARDQEVKLLRQAEDERAQARRAWKKWVLGGLGTIVLAIIMALLGLD